MDYQIEIIDTWGRRRAWADTVPLLEVTRRTPEQPSEINGLLPTHVEELGPGCTVRVHLDGKLFLEAPVTRTKPQWGDTSKLILDKQVPFHEALQFEAKTDPATHNRRVSRAFTNRTLSGILRDTINATLGPLHYTIEHDAYPEGAEREYAKFVARKTPENELEIGGIATGQWVDATRIDATTAYAKDGDTIAGLVVDGAPWPDLRLLMIDCEETSRNSHAFKRHPETEFWTDAEYNRSGYKLKADAAKAFLQDLIDTHGISHIELNPHRDVTGDYDDRVDAYGRYIALAYGGGQCFNAAMVENHHADIYLYEDGKYHDPAMELKDYFSYTAPNTNSLQYTPAILQEYDVAAGALEIITAIAYAANGARFTISPDHTLHFNLPTAPDAVLYFDPLHMTIQLGRDTDTLGNILYFSGNPFLSALEKTYTRGLSIDEYGPHARRFDYYSITRAADADRLAAGILDDLAYPAPRGQLHFFHGNAGLNVGDIIELRGAPVRRLERQVDGEHGNRYPNKLVARITEITHRLAGRRVQTTCTLGPPLRNVHDPLPYITRSQPGPTTLFELRLDDPTAALDLGFHLD